jgi:winged helix DNA-binding protein
VSEDRIRALRARSQRLLHDRLPDATALVRELVGVQAQEPGAAALSIRARTRGLTRAAVDRALVEERSIVRTWAMRGTIHLVPGEDAGWLTELLAPLSRRSSHRRLEQLGVPEPDRPRALAAIRAALAEHGPLTRAELMEHVARSGVPTAGQAAAHLTQLAALEGIVVFGPPRGAKPTYVPRDDWLGADLPRLSREGALAELARRYVRAYGPAAPEDLAAWSGLPLRDARAGWAAIANEVAAVDRRGWIATDRASWLTEPAPDPPVTRLLPAFDTYLLGYRSRDLAVPSEHARRVWPGGGIVRPTVVANGLAVGTWRRTGTAVSIEPFPGAELDAAAEAADVKRFLED